jgi:hypothetical protein
MFSPKGGKNVRILGIPASGLLALLAVLPSLAQQGGGNDCTPAGVWYGGSVVAYQMTIIPAGPAGNYSFTAQGMYKNAVLSTTYTGTVAKNGQKYEGSMMSLTTQDPNYLNPPAPPFRPLPDITAGWSSMEMIDCNTLRNTIPFFGLYTGAPVPAPFPRPGIPGIWKPGTPWSGIDWVLYAKVPLVNPPDVDLIPILTGDVKPIVETYHRLSPTVNPDLLHQ